MDMHIHNLEHRIQRLEGQTKAVATTAFQTAAALLAYTDQMYQREAARMATELIKTAELGGIDLPEPVISRLQRYVDSIASLPQI